MVSRAVLQDWSTHQSCVMVRQPPLLLTEHEHYEHIEKHKQNHRKGVGGPAWSGLAYAVRKVYVCGCADWWSGDSWSC